MNDMIPDYIIDRGKLKAKINKWRTLAFIAFALAVFSFFATCSSGGMQKNKMLLNQKYIARINVNGLIAHDVYTIKALNELKDDNNVKAVIVFIDTPGGSPVGGESIYNALRKISVHKPVAAVLGDIAIGADYIVAHNSTLTGSIGVYLQSYEFTGLAEKIGIKFESFKSSPVKGSPMPTEVVTPEVRHMLNETVQDINSIFLGLVTTRRAISEEYLPMIESGRVFTGRQAVGLGLVDKIGDEDDAVSWLVSQKNVSPNLQVLDYTITQEVSSINRILDSLAGASVSMKGLTKNNFFSFF